MKLIENVKMKIWKFIFKNSKLSYSQSVENLILDVFFCNIEKGIYVNIGAINPYAVKYTLFL